MKDSEKPGKEAFPLTNNSTRSRIAQTTAATAATIPPPRSSWLYTRWALVGLFCLLCTVGGTVTGNFYWKSALFRGIVNNVLRGAPGNPLAAYAPELQFPAEKQHTMNVMFLGCDSDWDPKKPVALKNTLTRSDAILIAHIDFDAKTINALSIPRDTAVHIPERGYNKINAAHALGGPELTRETVKSVFGIDVDYYMRLNFDGFMKVVDSLGGVDINVQKKLDYDDNWGNLHIHLKPGLQHMNGYHAMGYVRIRHSDDDIQRTLRQQDFMEALRSRIKSPTNLLRLPGALNAITESIKSDLNNDQLITLANFARQLPKEKIQVGTLPVTEGPSYVYIKRREDAAIIRKFFYNDDEMADVTVNAPGEDIIARITRKPRHSKRHGRRAAAVSGPQDDEGQPLLSNQDAPTTDGSDATASADRTAPDETPAPDSGGTDKPETPPKSDPKPDKKDGKKDGGGDKTPPADPAPEPKGGKPDAGAQA